MQITLSHSFPSPQQFGFSISRWIARWRKIVSVMVLFGVSLSIVFGRVSTALAAPAAQDTSTAGTEGTLLTTGSLLLPSYWYLLMAALALLVPAGFILVSVAGLEPQRAWSAALGSLAAVGLTGFSYWAVGFALQFGGVGLIYNIPELRMLVWEWSAFAPTWGVGWGMAGLSGWFLSGSNITPLVYALFLAHLPWAMTAAALPVIALRGRAPATATFILAFLMGGILYPLAGNWVQGGGWLSALGSNVNLGHGLIDFGGAGTVHLVAGGFAFAALLIWVPRRRPLPPAEAQLPPVQLPLLASVGALLILAGGMGWWWANPLQTSTLSETALMRGAVNNILYAGGGALIPLLYTWFISGRTDPMMTARGLVAGAVAGLACGPFVQPGVAFFIGLVAGGTVPFITYVTNEVLRLDDATGVVHASVVPALVGLLLVGIFADGATGAGWQTVGAESYLGVTGQGVSGLFVASGFQPNFPAQLQAQLIGMLALALWGFLTGMIICAPVALLYYGLQRSATASRQGQSGPGQSGRGPTGLGHPGFGQPGPGQVAQGQRATGRISERTGPMQEGVVQPSTQNLPINPVNTMAEEDRDVPENDQTDETTSVPIGHRMNALTRRASRMVNRDS